MKECPVCHEPATFDELLTKHMRCVPVDKEHKPALNTVFKLGDNEFPLPMANENFWEEFGEDVLGAIDEINEELDNKNVPLVVAEIVGLSQDERNWVIYVCNKETVEEEIICANGRLFNYTYPEEFPTHSHAEIAQKIIFENEELSRLASQFDSFKGYKIDFNNVRSSVDYEEERRSIQNFSFDEGETDTSVIYNQETSLEETQRKCLEKMSDENISFWKKIQLFFFYKLLGGK